MNSLQSSSSIDRQCQSGFVLFMTLVVLVILTILGLSSMQGASLEERMSSNLRDRSIAMQAAELALRDAERDLAALKSDGTTFCAAGTPGCRPLGARASNPLDWPGFWVWGPALRLTWTPDCPLGQCDSGDMPAANAPVWDDAQANWFPQFGSNAGNPTVEYGTYTGAAAIPEVAAQPRYILEIFPANRNDPYGTGGSESIVFRITVRAVGKNLDTVVMLQSVSIPN